MATITNYVRWASNTEELRRNLKEGLDSIEATRAGAEKLVQSLGGDKLIAAAHRMAAAVHEVGGAAKLTAAEKDRVNAVVTKAIEKYQALGKEAPAALKQLADATQKASHESELLGRLTQQLAGADTIANAQRYAAAVQQIGGAAKLTRTEQEQVNKAVTDAIAKFTALGQTAPKALTDLAKATKTASAESQALAKLTQQLGGGDTIANAQRYAAAVQQIGGVSKLTAAEQKQVNAVLTEALAKYKALGQQAPPAMQALANATKQAGTETNAAQRYVGDLGKTIGTMAAGFISAQAVIGAVTTAFRTFVGFVQDSAKAYVGAEAAQNKLVGALRAQSMATPEVIRQYSHLATTFQRTTAFGDDLLKEMQALLVQVGGVMPSAMQGALKASTDLAAGLGIDLQQATMLVAKAAAGHTETLGRYGITVSKAALESKGFEAVLEAVNRQFGGQAQAQLDTYAGKLQQVENLWGDLQEAVGKFLLDTPVFNRLLIEMGNALKRGNEAAQDSSIPHLISAIANSAPGVALFGQANADIARAWAILSEHEGWMEAAIDVLPTLDDYTKQWVKSLLAASEAYVEIERMQDRVFARPSPFQITAKAGELPPITVGLKLFDELAKKEEEARKAAEAHAKAIANLVDQLAGTTAAKQLADLTTAFRRLTSAQREDVQTIERLLAAYEPLRKQVAPGALPRDLEQLREAQAKLREEFEKMIAAFNKSRGLRDESIAAITRGLQGQQTVLREIATLGQPLLRSASDIDAVRGSVEQLQRAGRFLSVAMGEVNKQIGILPTVLPKNTHLLRDATGQTTDWRDALDEAADSMVQLAQVGGTAFSGIAQSLARSLVAVKNLAEGFKTLGKEGATAIERLSASLQLLTAALDLGDAINDLIDKVIKPFQEVFSDMADVVSQTFVEPTRVNVDELRRHLETLLKDVASGMNAIARGTVGVLNTTAAAIDRTTASGQAAFQQLRITGQDSFDRTGRLAMAAFNAAIAGGKSFAQALTELGPTFDELVKAQGTFGYATTETLQQLLEFRAFAEGPGKEVLSTLEGVNAMMSGLSKMGLLTQENFADLSRVAVDTYNQMIAGGVASRQALAAMQPSLQKIWELHKDQGFAIDENTQALLNEAEAQGLVGESMRGVQEQMLNVLKEIARALGADLPDAARKAARGINEELLKVPRSIKIGFQGEYTGPTLPTPTGLVQTEGPGAPGLATGGLVTALGVRPFPAMAPTRLPTFQGGGRVPIFAPIGTDTIPAMLTPGELILNEPQQQRMAALLEQGLDIARQLTGGKAAGTTVIFNESVTIQAEVRAIDGADVQSAVEHKILPQILIELEDHRRGYVSRMQRALAIQPATT